MSYPNTRVTSDYLGEIARLVSGISPAQVTAISDLFWDNYSRGARLLLCGNGGSGTTASHLATDFQKNVLLAGHRPWEVLALTDSMPLVTAWANDTEYSNIFAGQARCWVRPGDLLVAISGSGNSPNVLRAVETARELGATTVGWTGFGGGKLAKMVDHGIVVDAHQMQQVEDIHLMLGHMVYCEIIARIAALKG